MTTVMTYCTVPRFTVTHVHPGFSLQSATTLSQCQHNCRSTVTLLQELTIYSNSISFTFQFQFKWSTYQFLTISVIHINWHLINNIYTTGIEVIKQIFTCISLTSKYAFLLHYKINAMLCFAVNGVEVIILQDMD